MQPINTQSVLDLCQSHGFALCGVSVAKRTKYDAPLIKWLEDGKHGEMEWLNRNVEVRLDPSLLVEGAMSVICVADRYGLNDQFSNDHQGGLIARYARGQDYHTVMKKRLHFICDVLSTQDPTAVFRACVDTAPLLEREFAVNAGLGEIGKHTLLIEQGVGSWLLLGAIVTTTSLEPTPIERSDPCASCTRCIDACPTDAITPWSVDANKCISYLTIEHRTEIEPEFFSQIGSWIFGCDICQEVCPHNQQTQRTTSLPILDAYAPSRISLDVLEVLDWDEEARRAAFKGSSMKRAKLGMIRRNAVIVAGNILAESPSEPLLEKLQLIAKKDADMLVQNTAREVLKRCS